MISLFAALAPWKKFVDIAVVVALLAGALWIYLALVHRAEQIETLTAANTRLSKAAADDVAALQQAQDQLALTRTALKAEAAQGEKNAALAGQLKERISHAPKNGCLGPAERALLDGLRSDAAGRGSAISQPAAP